METRAAKRRSFLFVTHGSEEWSASPEIPNNLLKEFASKGAKGEARADGEKEFTFKSKDGDLNIPYEQVTRLEYGTKSHTTVGYSVLTGIHPKKVKDYLLTIEYSDKEQKAQSAVFKLGKNRQEQDMDDVAEPPDQ